LAIETEIVARRLADAAFFYHQFGDAGETLDQRRYAGGEVDQETLSILWWFTAAEHDRAVGRFLDEVVGNEALTAKAPQALVQLGALCGVDAAQVDLHAFAPGLGGQLAGVLQAVARFAAGQDVEVDLGHASGVSPGGKG